MENLFGQFKAELFYGEEFDSIGDFVQKFPNDMFYSGDEGISPEQEEWIP